MSYPKPITGLKNIAPYVGGESELKGFDKIVKLASNEGAFGPSPKTLEALKLTAHDFHRYPDGDCTELRNILGEKNNINYKNIICGAGSDELINLLCRCYAGPGDEILYSEHGFAMYPIYGKTVGASIVAAPENNRTVSVDGLLGLITQKTKIIFIANPNNPTGTYIPKREVERLVNNIPKNILLVIDSAYSEFVDRPDYTDGAEFVSANNNVVMLRTFSKIYGMGGLRLGWSYAPDSVLDILNRVRSPFNVSYPAIVSGIAALGDDEFLEMSQKHNQKWLKWTSDEIKGLGLTSAESVCNFLVVDFPNNNDLKKTAENADIFLKSKGIIVRRMGGYGLPDSLRITIGLEKEMKYLIESLKIFMSK